MTSALSGILVSETELSPIVSQQAGGIARNIADLGMMAVTAAFFLILSGIMWIFIFKWFKKVIDDLINSTKTMMNELLYETRKQNESLNDISEGLRSETSLRIKTISNTFFDLAVFKVLGLIKRVKKENHIDDREKTQNKIKRIITNLHADRKSKFDSFTYRGRKLSDYVNPDWVDMVSDVVEKEVYDSDPNDERALTNVKNVYDEIKVDLYNRLKTS